MNYSPCQYITITNKMVKCSPKLRTVLGNIWLNSPLLWCRVQRHCSGWCTQSPAGWSRQANQTLRCSSMQTASEFPRSPQSQPSVQRPWRPAGVTGKPRSRETDKNECPGPAGSRPAARASRDPHRTPTRCPDSETSHRPCGPVGEGPWGKDAELQEGVDTDWSG